MHPTETHQLTIQFVGLPEQALLQTKEDVKNWLLGIGEESFVEGVLDELFLDLEYGSSAHNEYQALGGDALPLTLYKYDREHLQQLQQELEKTFPKVLNCKLESLQTESWMEGWKDSFKPISTQSFYIYPPWLAQDLPLNRIPLLIEPGMAFGTGQHATTVLCLEALEQLELDSTRPASLLDVGTGTGILAIAAAKLGIAAVTATDIDPDSIIASRDNAAANGVSLELLQGTMPYPVEPRTVVIANIIFYVLRKIIGELAASTAPQGYLILSGLLADEARDMEELAKLEGLILLREQTKDDWACQVYRKD